MVVLLPCTMGSVRAAISSHGEGTMLDDGFWASNADAKLQES